MFKTGHSKVGGHKLGIKNQKTLLGANELLLELDINPITINTCWDADRLNNEEAKRIANEADFLVLSSFDGSDQGLSSFNKIASILFK